VLQRDESRPVDRGHVLAVMDGVVIVSRNGHGGLPDGLLVGGSSRSRKKAI
jgi:hypothetical protein